MLCLLQSAVGWEYQTELSKHGSQTDAAKGFGGRYGVQTDRQDEVSFDVKEVFTCMASVACTCTDCIHFITRRASVSNTQVASRQCVSTKEYVYE